jgi:hypothetical protein
VQPLEALTLRRCISGVMLLFIALLGADVRAAAPRAEVMPQMTAGTEVMPHGAPAMGDCMPCAYCYTGPASTVQGTSGESKEQDAPAWIALAQTASASQGLVNTSGERQSPVPVRIAYCRWSN